MGGALHSLPLLSVYTLIIVIRESLTDDGETDGYYTSSPEDGRQWRCLGRTSLEAGTQPPGARVVPEASLLPLPAGRHPSHQENSPHWHSTNHEAASPVPQGLQVKAVPLDQPLGTTSSTRLHPAPRMRSRGWTRTLAMTRARERAGREKDKVNSLPRWCQW